MLCKRTLVSRAWQGHCGRSLKWSRREYLHHGNWQRYKLGFFFKFYFLYSSWLLTSYPHTHSKRELTIFKWKKVSVSHGVGGTGRRWPKMKTEKWAENTHAGPCTPFGGPILILCISGGQWWSLNKVMSWLNFDFRKDLTAVKKMDERDTIIGWEEVAERAVSKWSQWSRQEKTTRTRVVWAMNWL